MLMGWRFLCLPIVLSTLTTYFSIAFSCSWLAAVSATFPWTTPLTIVAGLALLRLRLGLATGTASPTPTATVVPPSLLTFGVQSSEWLYGWRWSLRWNKKSSENDFPKHLPRFWSSLGSLVHLVVKCELLFKTWNFTVRDLPVLVFVVFVFEVIVFVWMAFVCKVILWLVTSFNLSS